MIIPAAFHALRIHWQPVVTACSPACPLKLGGAWLVVLTVYPQSWAHGHSKETHENSGTLQLRSEKLSEGRQQVRQRVCRSGNDESGQRGLGQRMGTDPRRWGPRGCLENGGEHSGGALKATPGDRMVPR